MIQNQQTLGERLGHRMSYYLRKMTPSKVRDSTQIPAVLHKDGYSVIRDAIWGLHDPHYRAAPFVTLAEECAKYEANIFFEVPSAVRKRASGKDQYGIMGLDLSCGTTLDIFVEDPRGKSAEGMAIRLYAGITTRGEKPDFNRFNSLINIQKRNIWSK